MIGVKRHRCEGWSVVTAKDEALPAIESWSIAIGTEALRLELKRRQRSRAEASRSELKRHDWNWSVAGQSRKVAGVWIVAIGSELKRRRCLKHRDCVLKRRRSLRWSVAGVWGEASRFMATVWRRRRDRWFMATVWWQRAGFWERMGWVSSGIYKCII